MAGLAGAAGPRERDGVAAWLADRLGPVTDVGLIGAGAWSRAYGFATGDGRELVARVGAHVDDFRADEAAAAFDAPDLPVPQTLLVEPGLDGWVSVTTRCHGTFLEELDADGWRRAWPALLAGLRQLWSIDPTSLPPATADRFGARRSWPAHLLAVDADPEGGRLPGARAALTRHPAADEAFRAGLAVLRDLASTDAVRGVDAAPRLIHSDLVNRNVLVEGGRLSGVFDWGCCISGDPVYELAWLDVWAPWHPGLAALGVRGLAGVEAASALGVDAVDLETRWQACALHICLSHLVYDAGIGDDTALEGVRLRTLSSL